MKRNQLTQFLTIREKLHSRLITGDELEVCGAFINEKINIKQTVDEKLVFVMTPDLSDIFDQFYQTKGLGFKNEKDLDIKTSGKYIPIGG